MVQEEGEEVKAVILAAGRGTRLKPLTYGIPKPLLPVGGKPVIDYVIDNLMAAHGEIDEIIVAVSYMRETIENYLKHTPRDHMRIETVTTLGWDTGGDLQTIVVEKEITGPVVVAYGDNVTKLNVRDLIQFHKRKGKPATLALFNVPWEDTSRFGIAELTPDSLVSSFVEKPEQGKTRSSLANAGCYVLEPEILESIPHRKVKTEAAIFPRLAREGKLAGFVFNPPYWLDIGTIDAYRKANKMIEGILPPE
ncbi:MAG: nucleotidyltransferase family protein [Candidatus ainarchaeum sp.]|nr:nucleotidyltransferase family protein [Candidatus ainarchaeum sp.]